MGFSEAFTDLNAKFIETVNGHDPRRWAALFSEDAVLIPAGQPSVTGRAGIETWAEGAMKIWNHLEIHDGGSCSTDGDVVWEQGTWTGNINVPDAKETMDISGNFLLVAEKEGAALRIKAHTWSVAHLIRLKTSDGRPRGAQAQQGGSAIIGSCHPNGPDRSRTESALASRWPRR